MITMITHYSGLLVNKHDFWSNKHLKLNHVTRAESNVDITIYKQWNINYMIFKQKNNKYETIFQTTTHNGSILRYFTGYDVIDYVIIQLDEICSDPSTLSCNLNMVE